MVNFHRVVASALSFRTQVGSIAKHFGKRNKCVDNLSAIASFHTFDTTTARVQIADNIAHVVLRNSNFYFHIRFKDNRVGFSSARTEAHRTCNFEGHFRRIDFMVRTIINGNFDINHWVTGNYAVFHSFLNTVFDRSDVFFRNSTANNFVLKQEAFTCFTR